MLRCDGEKETARIGFTSVWLDGSERIINMWFLASEDGQGLVSYALILILVAIVVVAALGVVGVDVLRLYTDATEVAVKTFTQ